MLEIIENPSSKQAPDKEFVIRSLELLTALFRINGPTIEEFIDINSHLKTI